MIRRLMVNVIAVALVGCAAPTRADDTHDVSATPTTQKDARAETVGAASDGPRSVAEKAVDEHGKTAKEGTPAARHWSYSGGSGPAHWGELEAEYRSCKTGTMQSPVDLVGATNAGLPKIEFDYRISPLEIVNNGHTVQINVAKGSSIVIDGERFELLQFHFHTPSEHLVAGKRFPMEMHFVHKNTAGQLAVIGVMVEGGAKNIAFQEIVPHLPKQAGKPRKVADVAINPRDLLPGDQRYYRYMGSLTTPPCTEGVNWYVLKQPVEVDDRQITTAATVIGRNARPPLPRNHRLLMSGN